MLGLCLVAVFAVAAVAATSASALPEFGQCVVQPKHEGKYTNNVCTKKAKKVEEKFTGEFEWKKTSEISQEDREFTGSGGTGVLEGAYYFCTKPEGGTDTEAGRKETCPEGDERTLFAKEGEKSIKIECEAESNHGIINGAKTVGNVSVTFTGCKLFGSSPCSNTVNEGEIHVNTLKGKLGWINKSASPREVGLDLEPAKSHGDFAVFSCLTGQIGTVVGEGTETEGCAYPLKACGGDGIISSIAPVNTMTTELTQKFVINEETQENIPAKFEGTAPRKTLESYIFNEKEPQFTSQWSKAAESITNVAVAKEAGEIKAN